MWPEYQYIEVAKHFKMGDTVKSTKWKRIHRDKLEGWIHNNPNARAYFYTIQSFRNPQKTEGEAHWADCFMDLDADDPAVSLEDARLVVDYFLKGFEVEPQVWFSGNKGFHITVPGVVFGAEPHTRLTYFWHHIVSKISHKLELSTLDERVYSIPRMWRIENTRHPTSGLFKVRLDCTELARGMDYIKGLAAAPRRTDGVSSESELQCIPSLERLYKGGIDDYTERQKQYTEANGKEYDFGDNVPPCVTELLDKGLVLLGTKNRADMALAAYCKTSGMHVDAALQLLSEWAQSIPESLTHVRSPRARMMQTCAVVRTVYGNPKYKFSCGSIKACGIDPDCSKCSVKDDTPLSVSLSEYAKAKHRGTKLAVEGIAIGRDHKELQVPRSIIGWCHPDPESAKCMRCSMLNYISDDKKRHERTLTFNGKNPRTLALIDVSAATLQHRIKRVFSIDERCYNFRYKVEWGNAQVIHIASRISADFSLEENISRIRALYLGHGLKLNQGYAFVGYVHAHPKTLAATLLIDKAESLRSSLATFELQKEETDKLKIFQTSEGQSPLEKVAEIHRLFINNFIRVYGREEILLAVDMAFHSARWINFQRGRAKGWLDILVVGDTRQGKSETVENLMKYYDLGTMAAGETASRTGLLYTIHMVAGEEAWIAFGLLCRANGLLVVVDEIHGMNPDDFREFTLVRSKGVVDVKRAAYGTAAAETRLISIANARSGQSMASYGYPVQAIPDIPCFRSLEDIARFDYAVGVRAGDVELDVINRDVYDLPQEDNPYTAELCKNLILWIWTRTPEQIIIQRKTERYILARAKEMSMEYIPDIPLVESADVRFKLLRLGTAFAGRTYNSPDGEKLIIEPKHIDAALQMLNSLYESPGLGYKEWSMDKAKLELTADQLIRLRQQFMKFSDWQDAALWILNVNAFNKTLLSVSLGISSKEATELLAFMLKYRFIESRTRGYSKTPDGRNFLYGLVQASRKSEEADSILKDTNEEAEDAAKWEEDF